jgi:AcrR family transcriptional regulator
MMTNIETPRRGRGRPRVEGTDSRIIETAERLLLQRSYALLTVDEVAAAAGIAKTTLYRRWPSKGALAAAVVASLAPATELPSHGTLAADLTALLERSFMLLAGDVGRIVAGIVGAAQDDNELLPIVRELIAPHQQQYRKVLRDAISRRELPADTDIDLVIDMLVSPLWSRLLVTHSTLSPAMPAAIVEAILQGVARH